MKRVAVTGLSGFIGRHVSPFLQELGYTVYPLRIDLNDPKATSSQIELIKPEALLHLAWDTTHKVYWHAPSNLKWLKSSLDLMESFVQCGGKRVVIAGSCAEMNPTTLYGASKESLRLCAENYLTDHHVSFAWGRIFSPYGPHEKPERLIPSLIQTLLDEDSFHCSAGQHVRDFLYVEDVAEAFSKLLASEALGTVDIGSGKGIRIQDLALQVAQLIGGDDKLTFSSVPASADNPSALVANTSRLSHEVGFQPKHTLQQGIQQTINWWKNEICHRH